MAGKQGFASMDVARRREIASQGGKAAHRKGTGHQWTSEEARAAGRKGGLIKAAKRVPLTDEEARTAVTKAFEDITR